MMVRKMKSRHGIPYHFACCSVLLGSCLMQSQRQSLKESAEQNKRDALLRPLICFLSLFVVEKYVDNLRGNWVTAPNYMNESLSCTKLDMAQFSLAISIAMSIVFLLSIMRARTHTQTYISYISSLIGNVYKRLYSVPSSIRYYTYFFLKFNSKFHFDLLLNKLYEQDHIPGS